jgi:hypothetical protein
MFILIVFSILFSQSYLNASEEINNEYNLRIKLIPKIVESNVYWPEKQIANWQKEVKKWHFGFLPSTENCLPLLVFNEGFSLGKKFNSDRYRELSQKARLLVVNPIESRIKVNLVFWAESLKKDKKIKIFVNGYNIKTVFIHQNGEFNEFHINGITLEPGKNEVIFLSLENTVGTEHETANEDASIRLRDNIKWEIVSRSSLLSTTSGYTVEVEDNDFVISTYFKDKNDIFLASRDLNMDLEEYPFMNLDCYGDRLNVITYLGIDYSGDGNIDGYLVLNNCNNLENERLFDLIKEKWGSVDYSRYGFKLKKIILLMMPDIKKNEINILGTFKLKNFNLSNDKCLILEGNKFSLKHIDFIDTNKKFKVVLDKNMIMGVNYSPTFFSKGEESYPLKNKISQNQKSDYETILCSIPLKCIDIKNYSNFSFSYKLSNFGNQSIELGILKDKRDDFIRLEKTQYEDVDGRIEIDLGDVMRENRNLNSLVIILNVKKVIDCDFPIVERACRFQLSDFMLYEKLPYPIKTESTKEKFFSLFKVNNFSLLMVDNSFIRLSDFANWNRININFGDVLCKILQLSKGEHQYEKLDNATFNIKWLVLEPKKKNYLSTNNEGPKITFKKINPTKYLVRVEEVKDPFWIVFNDNYNSNWRLYRMPNISSRLLEFSGILSDYRRFRVKETKYAMEFTPTDIKYLFRKPLEAPHQMVNGYANGWYIDPKKTVLGSNFVLTIYYWPQSFFYLGLFIVVVIFITSLVYLIWPKKRK